MQRYTPDDQMNGQKAKKLIHPKAAKCRQKKCWSGQSVSDGKTLSLNPTLQTWDYLEHSDRTNALICSGCLMTLTRAHTITDRSFATRSQDFFVTKPKSTTTSLSKNAKSMMCLWLRSARTP